jgi:heat shock protein HslJ
MERRTVGQVTLKLAWLPVTLALAACAGDSAGPMGPSPMPSGSMGGSASSTGQVASQLQGKWRLQRIEKTGGPGVAVQEPDRFVADFTSDSRVQLVADCNRCAAGYTAGANSLSVSPMACTRAYCSTTAPMDTDFAGLVGAASYWSVSGGQLKLSSSQGSLFLAR